MKALLSKDEIIRFQFEIYNFYNNHGRDLPWRKTRNPYHILVSEIMLQQTQVDRCLKKYNQFIDKFPDFLSLVHAPVSQIVSTWQGLGYNRRALALKKIAVEITDKYKGQLPADKTHLLTLPSIGKATAASILAFAFNRPVIIIETNIRVVFIHFFMPAKKKVKDVDLIPYINATLDKDNPRKWYYALMDYGVRLKKINPSLTQQSAHYKKQSPFKGSDRQIRGKILKILTQKKQKTEQELLEEITGDSDRISRIINNLVNEGFLEIKDHSYRLKK